MSDGRRERELVLVEKIVVGRDPTCELSHDDPLLSRRHAEFVGGSDRVTVRDLGSRNGIFVNGLRAAERILEPGDVVQIGILRVRYTQDRTPVSILPEQLIADATVVVAPPRPASPPPTVVRQPAPPDREDDRTRISSPAVVESPRPAPPKPPPPVVVDTALQDGPTVFMPPPPASHSLPASEISIRTSPLAHAPTPGTSNFARDIDADISAYVFVQVALAAAVVLFASFVPLLAAGGGTLSVWLAIPFVAAVVATYLIGRLINRRFLRIVRALKHDAPVGRDPFR